MTVGELRHATMGRAPGEEVILMAPTGHFYAGTYAIGRGYFGLLAGRAVVYEENWHAEPSDDNPAGPPPAGRDKHCDGGL